MCCNTHWVYNRYIKRSVLVDCGRCPTCLQQKALHRVNRIRNNLSDGQICIFVTLTYRNECIPYVWRRHFEQKWDSVSVFRDCSCRYVRTGKGESYRQSLKFDYHSVKLDEFWLRDEYDDDAAVDYIRGSLVDLEKYPNRIGVCYYPDLQKFYKRFRQNLVRHYGYNGKFTTFSVSEYGGQTQRPHFHLLIFCEASAWEIFRDCVDESWPFNDKVRCPLYVDIARDAASYVSSYVNCGSSLSSVLQTSPFRQKHSYSKGFGLALVSFSLAQIRKKIVSGDLWYYSTVVRDGISQLAAFPIPKYVINRYFPQFKGFSRIAPGSLSKYIREPERIFELRYELDYSVEDELRIYTRLENAYQRYHDLTGLGRFDYAIDYERVWSVHSSVVIRGVYEQVRDVFEWPQFYDNANDYVTGVVRSLSLDSLGSIGIFRDSFQVQPNYMRHRVMLRNRLEPLYYKLCKQKIVTNIALSAQGFDV